MAWSYPELLIKSLFVHRDRHPSPCTQHNHSISLLTKAYRSQGTDQDCSWVTPAGS